MAEARTDLGRLIDERPLSGMQIAIVLLCALVVFLDGYDIQVMSLAVPAIAQEWGILPTAFGWVLSISLVGIGLGGSVVAPVGDSRGRRPVLIAAVALVGASTLAAGYAQSVGAFFWWRLLTGVALGASQPLAITLTSEMMPARRRALLVTAMFCTISFGAMIAGFTAPALIGVMGWRGLFLVGGGSTLLLSALLIAALPESLRFLIARRPGHRRIAPALRALAPGLAPEQVYVPPDPVRPSSPLELLNRTYWSRTLLMWSIYALNVFVTYMLISWLPTLLKQAGFTQNQAFLGASFYQGGSVIGGLALSWAVDAGRPKTGLVIGYGLSILALALLNVAPHEFRVWSVLIALTGAGIAGAQFILIVLAAAFYPLNIRATGVGWTGTASRVGAATAPLVGAWLIKTMAPGQAMTLLVVPTAMCALLALVIQRGWWTSSREGSASPAQVGSG